MRIAFTLAARLIARSFEISIIISARRDQLQMNYILPCMNEINGRNWSHFGISFDSYANTL
jgi:hypothetical protein